MFFRKKEPVLSARYCSILHHIRRAVEVLTGGIMKLDCFDFNTGKGKMQLFVRRADGSYMASPLIEVTASFGSEPRPELWFSLEGGIYDDSYNARFDGNCVRVINGDRSRAVTRAGHSMWTVGYSSSERWEEPLRPDEVAHCAQVRGVTVEEYLKS